MSFSPSSTAPVLNAFDHLLRHRTALRSLLKKLTRTRLCTAILVSCPLWGQNSAPTLVSYDQSARLFRLDAGGVTYAFGINDRDEIETVYWGGRVAPSDKLPRPPRVIWPFEITDTPQEFAGWGGGLETEPALKLANGLGVEVHDLFDFSDTRKRPFVSFQERLANRDQRSDRGLTRRTRRPTNS